MTAIPIIAIISTAIAAYLAVFFATYRPQRLASKAMTLLCAALTLDRGLLAVIPLSTAMREEGTYITTAAILALGLLGVLLLVIRRQLEPLP